MAFVYSHLTVTQSACVVAGGPGAAGAGDRVVVVGQQPVVGTDENDLSTCKHAPGCCRVPGRCHQIIVGPHLSDASFRMSHRVSPLSVYARPTARSPLETAHRCKTALEFATARIANSRGQPPVGLWSTPV